MRPVRESLIEQTLVRRVEALGGLCEKFASPGRRGVPDRIISMPGGVVVFVEVKAPGKKPTRLQLHDHARRRALGFRVEVIDSMDAAKNFTV